MNDDAEYPKTWQIQRWWQCHYQIQPENTCRVHYHLESTSTSPAYWHSSSPSSPNTTSNCPCAGSGQVVSPVCTWTWLWTSSSSWSSLPCKVGWRLWQYAVGDHTLKADLTSIWRGHNIRSQYPCAGHPVSSAHDCQHWQHWVIGLVSSWVWYHLESKIYID